MSITPMTSFYAHQALQPLTEQQTHTDENVRVIHLTPEEQELPHYTIHQMHARVLRQAFSENNVQLFIDTCELLFINRPNLGCSHVKIGQKIFISEPELLETFVTILSSSDSTKHEYAIHLACYFSDITELKCHFYYPQNINLLPLIQACPQLIHIYLHNVGCDFSHITQALESFCLSFSDGYPKLDCAILKRFTNLKILSLDGIRSINLTSIIDLPINDLKLDCKDINPSEVIHTFFQLSKLEELILRLDQNIIIEELNPPLDFASMRTIPWLKKLKLIGNGLSIFDMTCFNILSVTKLSISHCMLVNTNNRPYDYLSSNDFQNSSYWAEKLLRMEDIYFKSIKIREENSSLVTGIQELLTIKVYQPTFSSDNGVINFKYSIENFYKEHKSLYEEKFRAQGHHRERENDIFATEGSKLRGI